MKTETKLPVHTGKKWVEIRRWGLIASALVFAGVLTGLLVSGFPWWESLLWALGLALPIPVRFKLEGRGALWLSRLFWAVGPVVGYSLVEILNWNNPFTSFSTLQVALNLAFYYIIALVVWLVVGRRNLSCGISTALFWVIGMANHYVIAFRGRTIFPGDLLTLGTAVNVAGNYNYAFDTKQALTGLALALFLLLLLTLPRQKGRARLRLRSAVPVTAICAAFLVVFFGTSFLSAVGIEPSMWTTRGNGFVLNFSVCLRYSSVSEPEGYSQEALAEIVAGVEEDSVPVSGTEDDDVQPVNVIVIMNESFSDLTGTFDLETNQDPMPFFRSLTENTIRGTAYSSVFGGTTANSEYEFLTGNTTAFLPAGTVPFHLYVKEGSESMVAQMSALGYECVAMHPYYSSGWNRIPVYQAFGFDRWLFQSDFENPTYIRSYISDQTDYENLIRIYEEKEEGEPLFIFNVTMQNHSAYSGAWTNLAKEVWLTGEMEGKYNTVNQYLNLIYQSDKAFEYLINYFSQVEEPTMILMFGDHQPQVATNFYTDLLGSDPTVEEAQKKQEVPFLIWANYDIEEQQDVKLSLNYLSGLLMDAANLPKTGYQTFLSQLRETVPAVNAVGYQDTDGTWHEQTTDMSQAAQEGLLDYQMLQYNEIFEDRDNRLEDFFFLPEKE